MTQSVSGLKGASYKLDDLVRLRFNARRLKLKQFSRARSSLVGSHQSKIRGRGMSFVESRLYQPGDDVRLIDWRVTARSGRTHTKVFEEEKERPVFLVADFGSHMKFGSRHAFKHVVAAEIAALLAWAALDGGDRIGALLAADQGHIELRPGGGRRTVTTLLQQLVKLADAGIELQPSSLKEALARATHVVHPGSLVYVLSDFHDLLETQQRALSRLCQHNDVVLVQILDHLERNLPPPGSYPVSDGQRVRIIDLNTRGSRQRIEAEQQFNRRRLQQFADSHGLARALICAGDDIVEKLRCLV